MLFFCGKPLNEIRGLIVNLRWKQFQGEIFKVFLHLPPPLERESLLGLLNRRYQKWPFCQYPKWDCENYLFKNYSL